MIKLSVDVYGEEIRVFEFSTELETLEWLIDAGFKTHNKGVDGNLYRRDSDAAYARTTLKHEE